MHVTHFQNGGYVEGTKTGVSPNLFQVSGVETLRVTVVTDGITEEIRKNVHNQIKIIVIKRL